jgi:acyl-coenzyme A synthetase/AMP-(fatty) acid ligase
MIEKLIDYQAKLGPSRSALWTEAGGISFAAFARDVAKMTTALAAENLPAGVVLIGSVNPALHWLLTLALERLGHPTAFEAMDMDSATDIIRPSVVITRDAAWRARADERVLVLSDAWRRRALMQPPNQRLSTAQPDDIIRIVLSSGTTGERKPIPLRRDVLDLRTGRPPHGPSLKLRYLQTQGMDTVGGFQHPLMIWAQGGLVMIPTTHTEEKLRRLKPNYISVSPSRLREILPLMANAFTDADGVHVRVVGSAMPPSLIRAVLDCPGLDVVTSYSSTEAGTVASGPAALAITRPGAVGFPAPWVEIEIVDDQDRAIPSGQTGVIRIKTPSAVQGYLGAAPGSDSFRDGWFYPNDIGRIDEDGVLIIEGRADDVINLGGAKLSATRIEEVILGCPHVEDAAVVAFPMASGQWSMFAAVSASNGYDATVVRQRVWEAYNVNVTIVEFDKIPRNAMGKIQRNSLIEKIMEEKKTPTQ